MRPTAGNAALRPAQNSSRSSSEVETRHSGRTAFLRDRLDSLQQVIDFGGRPVEFDNQQRLDIERISRMDEFLNCVNRRTVHHLHAARNDASADDAADAFAGLLRRRKPDQHCARGLGLFQNANRHLGDDTEQSFRSGDETQQVVAFAIQVLPADTQHLTGDQHDLAAEHVIGGHAVFQAVHAARVLRDVAADRTRDLRGRIGRVVEAFVRNGLR